MIEARKADRIRILDAMAQMEGLADARDLVPVRFHTGKNPNGVDLYVARVATFEMCPVRQEKADRILEFYTVLRIAGLLEPR